MVERTDFSDKNFALLAKSFEEKSTDDINIMIKQLHDVLDQKKKDNIREVYERLVSDTQKLGFESIQDFIEAAEVQGLVKISPLRTQRRMIPIRYRNPEDSNETWTGRGKQPRWLVAKLEQGHSIDEFEISQEEMDLQIRSENMI
ncbi:H-NS histone family protein [Acinetobacter sp. SA01]|uniref:H-NS histone family protein n=1 Tax=Acinetobacter sp. SA01 TaxID=1862567 RepID=UPI00140CF634|nr:H-NS histone family protein [Acinetobacter sp. SA01]